MGQQQLLLVILVVIVVGIATIVATNVISTGHENANKDAIRQDLATAASNAQQIYSKPLTLGGVGGNFSEGLEDQIFFESLGIPGLVGGENGDIENENAIYDITRGESVITITATPKSSSGEWTMNITRSTNNNATSLWTVVITDGDGNVFTVGDENS